MKAGEKEKESARGTMGRGKREERERPTFSPLPIVPRALSIFFDYCYFQEGYPAGTSAEERGADR